MVRKRVGRSVKNNRNVTSESEELVRAPHSFVIHRGLRDPGVVGITQDFRRVMEPFTASSLKARKKNAIKDFVSISGYLHVSHLCIFSRTDIGTYFKVAKLPQGPTLSFKMKDFCLARDVVSSLRKQVVIEKAFKHPPVVILNGFSGEDEHLKLMSTTFQNMFPSINLTTVNINDIRRCVLINYNASTSQIDFRHYIIKIAPTGVARGVKKIVQGKVPNLARCDNIADFFTKTEILSDSEMEDDPNSHVIVPQKLAQRGTVELGKSAVRLSELGPRLTLELVKIEDGLMDGEVLYHGFVHKSEEEILEIQKKREAKRKLKERRKRVQEQNKKNKEEEKERHRQKSMRGKLESDKLMQKVARESEQAAGEQKDDDAQYYREEVGEEPEAELFTRSSNSGFKRPSKQFAHHAKRKRFGDRDDRGSKRGQVRKGGDKTNSRNRDHRPIGGNAASSKRKNYKK